MLLFAIIFCNDLYALGEVLQDRAPRPGETDGIENQIFAPETGSAACCPLPRDGNFTGNLYVGGDLTVVGTIAGSIVFNPPLILKPLTGNTACIIFETSAGAETGRICGTTPNQVYISTNGGVTQNLTVGSSGAVTLRLIRYWCCSSQSSSGLLSSSAGADGQLLIGAGTSAAPVWANLTSIGGTVNNNKWCRHN